MSAKFLSVSFLVLISQISLAQLKVTKLSKADIPAAIHYPGHVMEVFKYSDSDGEHLVFTTETGILNPKGDDDYRGADLYAFNYKINGSQYTFVWQIHDFVKDCPVDITAKFVKNTFAVTDLNNDGKAEIWVMYRTACRGDVSAPNMKIIMYEGAKKYAVRGEAKVSMGTNPPSYYGGSYTLDNAFKTGPDTFKKYAEALWKKNLMEKF
ncbi:hypothetical protein BDD43_5540 [Mucilaginibacter gracilis]|uniref:FG-GAP repeat protein n=1 Tax=Mucilaginibacter gracilis TaxID=423350 RepID=A0A495J8G2_9SPHI|nr:hypothetical protein [Mucilaginibacter gracilis]RKR85276.1 hypothetical protein BDD43_5540 [Mucilaginibacter gracilis]